MKKRVLSLVMAFILCLSQLPAEVFAEGTAVNVVTGAERGTEQTGEDGSGAESGAEQAVADGSGAESGTEQAGEDGSGAENGTEQTGADGDGADSVSNGNSGIAADPESAAGTPMLLAANEADTVNVAAVTIGGTGGTTMQYTSLADAFTAAQEAESATVTLLSNVTNTAYNEGISLRKGNITFDLNGHTLTGYADSNYGADIVLWVTGSDGSDGTPVTAAALTLKDSEGGGKIVQPGYLPVINVGGDGELTVEGGTLENTTTVDKDLFESVQGFVVNCAILTSGETIIRGGTMSGRHGVVVNGGTLTVKDGTFTGTTGHALIVYDGTAQLSGGSYSNDTSQNEHSILVENNGTASSLLAEGYRYETTDGKESGYNDTGSGVKGNTTVKARPAGEFSYIDADGNEAVQTGCKEITADTTELTDGWYEVKGNVTASDPAFVSGKVNLILCDGAEWNLSGELRMGNDATLNIYVQRARTGRLTATGWGKNPAIGMGNDMSGGTLNIYGGVITATSHIAAPLPSGEIGVSENRGAAIGTCGESSTDMSVNIYGGTVTAKATYGAQAIGSGQAATGTVNVDIANGMKCVRTDDLSTPAAYGNTDGTSVTITECSDHQLEYKYTEGGENHTSTCKLCGTVGTAEAHAYENWKADEGAETHTGTCVCGATKTEPHNKTFVANADGLTHAVRCSTCGHEAQTADHSFDDPTTGNCACGAKLAAKYDGKSYATIQSAVDAAKENNGTVTVQEQNAGMFIGEKVTVDSGSVTIDLSGDNWIADGECGGVTLHINGASVTLKNGTLSQGLGGTYGASAVLLESGSLTVEENVEIAGGRRGPSGTEYAIEVNGGELTLGKGVTLVLGLKVPDGKKLADYLTAGTAFAHEDDTMINGYITDSTTENLKVVEHSHTFTKNEEDGGYYCECGYKCPHSFGENGKCTDCGAQAVAKIGEDGYLSVKAALDAVTDGGTITLLADVSENVTVEAGKKVTFDFNGHSWNAGGTHTITVNGNVTVTGNGVMQNSNKNVNDIFVGDGGQVHLTAGMTFSRVWAHDNASVTLDAGVIITNNIFSGGSDISGLFTGKALQRYDLESKGPVEGSYVPLNKNYDMYPTGCVIVIEHTKHVYESGTTGYCDVCGAACDHANMKITDQSCPDCHAEYVASVVLTDVNGAAYPERFTVLQEALAYANSAWIAGTDVKVKKAELTLLKDETVTGATGEVCTFNELTDDMTVDINLNGKTLTCGSRFLVIHGGKVSIHDGSIHCTNVASISAIYVVRAERLNPELTLTNVNITTTSDEFNETFSVCVHDGKLTIQGEGQYSALEVYESDGVQLFGGSFEGIKMPVGDDFTSLLAEGYIYEDESGNFMSGDALANQEDSTMNSKRGYRTNAVRVVKCENHDFADSKCTKCGFACLHKDGEESTLNYGVCTVCGYACPHEHLSEADGVTACSDCKAQMAVKVEYTEESGDKQTKYYAQTFDDRTNTENTLQTILNDDTITPDGSTITLLANDLWAFAFVNDGKTVTLNLNGKNLIETGNGITVDPGSTLKVTGEGSSTRTGDLDQREYSYVFNVRGGTLEFDDLYFGGTFNGIRVGSGTLISPRELQDNIYIGTLQIDDAGAKVSFKAAAFDKIDFGGNSGSVMLGDLLGVWQGNEGKYRYGNAFQKADGTLLRYDTLITGTNPVENVKTACCHHDSVTGRTCDYCGMENLTAIVIDGGGATAHYTAADDSTEAEKTSMGYALNSWKNNGTNKTLKLFVDVTLTADVSLNAGKHPETGANLKTTRVLDLNGHNFTDAGGAAYGVVVSELVTLTIRDNSAGKGSFSAGVTVNDGGSLIVDGVHMGTITATDSTAKVTLKAGSSFEGYSLPAGMLLADWIEEGCFIYDTGADGNARTPVALTTIGVGEAAGKFVVEKAAVKVTAGITTGEIVYGSSVAAEFCPEVTITDAEAYENFGFIKVDWYRRTDSGCKLIGSGTIKDGSYEVTLITPDFNGVKAGDTLEVFCTITAVDNTDAEFWQTVITGYKLEVVKGNSSVITAPKATVLMVYRAGATDKKWSLVTKGKAEGGTMVYSLSKDGEYTETIPTAENAGSYTVWYKVSGDENHIDTEPESVTAKIERVLIRISSFELKEKIYDGTTGAEVIVVNFQDTRGNTVGSELALGMDYTVKAEFDDANVGSDVSVTVRVIPQDTVQMGNYLLDDKVQGTREIKKAAAPSAAEGTLYILNSHTDTYTFDLSRLLPGLDAGCEFGDVTFDGAQVTMKDGTGFNVTAVIDEKRLVLTTSAIDSEEGEVGTVTIKVVTDNYKDFTLTVKIVSTSKKIVELKEGSTVAVAGSNQLTYGQKLSELTLGSAVFVERGTDTEIKGTLKWSSPDAVPAAGTTTAEWIFVPDEAAHYKEVTGSASIKVEKADPVVTELPTAAEREYDPGRALTAADLTGGAASVAGQWSWKQTGTDIIPTVGNAGYEAVFTPQDTSNYNTVTKTIAVKVTKAAPYIAEKPAAAAITYGETLADSTLTGGKAAYKDAGGTVIAGSFEWKQGSLKPAVADSNVTAYEVTFIPEDKVNYNTADTKVALTVNKAAVVPNMPGTTMQPAHSTAKVKDITLPGGWSWSEDDRDKELEDNVPITAEAVYTGADKDNYETLRVTITITRRDCDHNNRETRNRKDATCTAEGYTGDIYCADCGRFLTAGGKAAPLGHDYKPAVTKEPTVTEEGVETYTCTRCRDSYTVSIPKLPGGNIGERMERDTGNGNNPGAGTEDGGSNGLPEEVPETTPYIRDENGKEGWEVIESRLRDAGEGTAVTVVMNGTAVVPKAIFDSISGKDITIILDMGENISWKINGRDITEAAGDIDLGVKTGAQAGKTIPVDVINQVSGERYSLNLTLSYDGEFGFTAKLSVNMDSENVGLYANLFYYNEQTGELEFVSAGQIGEDGYTELAFTHASDYVIVIDVAVMDGSSEDSDGSGVTEDTDGTGAGEEKTPAADDADGGSAKNVIAIVLAVICILLILAGAVWCYARRKNGSEKE